MRDLTELNVNAGGEPVKRRPPSEKEIADFEGRHGITLPRDYVALLSLVNGGHPELDTFLSAAGSALDVNLNEFFHLGEEDEENATNLWAATKTWRPYLGSMSIPIANDGLGNVIFLDMSSGDGTVHFCDHERGFQTVVLARSFAEFVDHLCKDIDGI